MSYLLILIIVEWSSKSHLDGGEFDHLVAYSMICTIENDDEHELKHAVIRFGSLDEVSVGDDLACLNEAKRQRSGVIENGSTSRALEARSSKQPAGRQ